MRGTCIELWAKSIQNRNRLILRGGTGLKAKNAAWPDQEKRIISILKQGGLLESRRS